MSLTLSSSFTIAQARPTPKPKKKKPSTSYTTHTVGRQIVAPAVSAFFSLRALQASYAMLLADYAKNPHKDIFLQDRALQSGLFRTLYDPKTSLGRAASRLLIGTHAHAFPLTTADIQALQRRSAHLSAQSSLGLTLGQTTRLLPNVAALSTSDATGLERVPLILDTTSLFSNMSDSALYTLGSQLFGQSNNAGAVQALQASQRLNVFSSGLVLSTGLGRLAVEIDRGLSGDNINGSSLFYGALDTGNGAIGVLYSGNVVQQAGKATDAADRAKALLGYTPMPPLVQNGMRVLGGVGAGIGVVSNGLRFSTSFDPSLSADQRQQAQISSTLGLIGSGAMVAGMLLVTPALMPVSGALCLIGTVVLIGQSAYDYRREIRAMVAPQKASLPTSVPKPKHAKTSDLLHWQRSEKILLAEIDSTKAFLKPIIRVAFRNARTLGLQPEKARATLLAMVNPSLVTAQGRGGFEKLLHFAERVSLVSVTSVTAETFQGFGMGSQTAARAEQAYHGIRAQTRGVLTPVQIVQKIMSVWLRGTLFQGDAGGLNALERLQKAYGGVR
jgi:hypothetical protein